MNTINWHDQVKVGRGATDTGSGLLSAHRALDVARDLHVAGRWNGTGLIVIPVSYTHLDVYKRQSSQTMRSATRS